MQRRVSGLWILLSLFAVSAPAFAQEEGDTGEVGTESTGDSSAEASAESADGESDAGGPAKPISAALLLGYGLDLDAPGDVNPFGIGFGVRGGYNLDAIYLGARFMFFLGDSEEVTVAGMTYESSFNVMMIGVEGGYDIAMDKLTIRPQLGLGLTIASGETSTPLGTFDDSSTDLYIAPGGTLLYDIDDSIFVGGELTIPIILSDPGITGLTIMLTGGMRF